MAGTVWDPVDPEDVVYLWFEFDVGNPPHLAPERSITSYTVTPPADPAGLVIADVSLDGQKIRFKEGPSPLGRYLVKCHITLDNGEERDVEGWLTVKNRIVLRKANSGVC